MENPVIPKEDKTTPMPNDQNDNSGRQNPLCIQSMSGRLHP